MNLGRKAAQSHAFSRWPAPGRQWVALDPDPAPRRNGRLAMNAMPRSAASGRMRCSTSAIADVVGPLHEIDRPGAHDRLQLGVPPGHARW